jgi:hypothetical protein
VGDFNIPLSQIAHLNQKNQQRNLKLNTINQMDLTDIYRIFHSIAASAAHGTFSKIDHNLVFNVGPNKYNEIEITSCILSDHNGIKLEINSKRNCRKYSNTLYRIIHY